MTEKWVLASVCVVWKEKAKKHVALILRPKGYIYNLSGKWFFPGGDVELGEQPLETAARETKEETGIAVKNLRLIGAHTTHEFWGGKNMSRKVHVALVFYEGFYSGGKLTPTEESEGVSWVAKKDLKKYLDKKIVKSHVPAEVRKLLSL